MRALTILLTILFVLNSYSKESKNKIVYKYKQYEKFDFEDMLIEGDSGGPGDLSINPRFQRYYKNRLPNKPDFNKEIKNTIDSIN